MAQTETLGWKWEVTHDGPVHHWTTLPPTLLSPASPPVSHPPVSHPPVSHPPASHPPASHPPASHPPASHPPASKDTSPIPIKTKLSAHWYVLHDGVVVPFYDP